LARRAILQIYGRGFDRGVEQQGNRGCVQEVPQCVGAAGFAEDHDCIAQDEV